MKQLFFLVILFALVQISCTKTDCNDSINEGSLAGKWRMFRVKDNATGFTTTKPSSITGEVEITITPASSTNGSFIGKTPSNDIWKNDYSIGVNQSISIPVLSMTKVAETSWGNEFVSNIRSSQEYSFENGYTILKIRATNKTLTFKKI